MTLTPAEHARVWLAFLEGESITDLALRHNVTLRTVEDWLRKPPRWNYSRRTNGVYLRSLRIAAGKTLAEAALLVGKSKSYLGAVETISGEDAEKLEALILQRITTKYNRARPTLVLM